MHEASEFLRLAINALLLKRTKLAGIRSASPPISGTDMAAPIAG